MIIPDANLLIYAYNTDALEYERSKEWLEGVMSGPERVCLCWQTITAFLRITTNHRAFQSPLSTEEAFEFVEEWMSLTTTMVLTPTQNHLEILKRLAKEGQAKGPLLMDAHLAALAIEHGAVLATTDRDFRRFDGLKIINPLIA